MVEFNAESALEYAKRIAYPRLVGTQGEQRAREMLTAWFHGLGYQVESRKFHFNNILGTLIKIEVLAAQLLILAGILGDGKPSHYGLIAGVAILFLLAITPMIQRAALDSSLSSSGAPTSPLWKQALRRLGKGYHSANLIASLPGNSKRTDRPRLVLMAHYDSKSQTSSLPTRIVFFLAFLAGGIIFSSCSLLGWLYPLLIQPGNLAGAVAVLSGIPLLFLNAGNNSPGGLDNASGVGVLVHLAEKLATDDQVHENLEILFVASGAEEFALMGARALLRDELASDNRLRTATDLYLLNLDGPGGAGSLNLSTRRKTKLSDRTAVMASYVQECCERESVRLLRVNLPSLMMDHMPFAEQGVDAVSISTLGWQARVVHTPGDTADRLSESTTAQAGRVILCVINRLAGLS